MKTTLEDLIFERLCSGGALGDKLAAYNGKPAIFYQNAPDDTAEGWHDGCQYPRIDYYVDYQRNPERKTNGVLTANIWCLEAGELPENIEPHLKRLLCGVFLKPNEAAPPYSLMWARSDVFDASKGDNIIIGVTLSFDVYAFPSQITSDPDPILAINEYMTLAGAEDNITVIGRSEIPNIYVPTALNPAFYFRLESLSTRRQTNTTVWLNGVIAGHIFAAGEEIKWLKAVVDNLSLDGEILMLDNSPMFVENIKADSTLDALVTGQLRINVTFGLLRRKPFAHKLINAYEDTV